MLARVWAVGRIFNPCSYLIYSDAFESLPDKMKESLYRRLWEILTGHDSSPDFQRNSPGTRRAVFEILRDTKPDLPDYWKR